MNNSYEHRVLVGNGAAQNIELGYVPEFAMLINATDGDLITIYNRGKSIPFSGGGTTEIAVGDTITGATSGATAKVRQVLLYSGTWAGGDAAGFFIANEDDITGTWASENAYVSSDTTSGIDDATVTAAVELSQASAAAIAGATGNSAMSAYVGSAATYAKGITVGSTIAEEAKLLHLHVWR